ncbi:MAG: DNA mismatch repair protein MutL [uncultured Rubrobacteraceae bacterium]|uniref:DNA mismatch repair protein MutL n=1 Tax=uncultured Rubrobacteraceae bacterium TaxID=349277 RepID=A0A6J4S2D3_9ACTN|nr:MAG: DNA mismatch repair protein MutL [uncultured Rubrobacteraceae bacterium]
MKLFPRVVSETGAPYGAATHRVHVLPPEVAHRIAAGEVIERPASAVKELVENALDAGATRVEVEIEGGGTRLLRVRDDGSGMSPEDAERAVARHATSKISTAEDLALVASLGFRGEALHAISSVSSLTLTTSEPGAPRGTRVRVRAGGPARPSPSSHPQGTTVEARDLFLNLPVRRGFLGTERAEANAVASVVEALAVSRPEVGFFLSSEGRGLLALPAAADLRERVAQVHGLSLARGLVVLGEPGEVVWGLVSPLSVSFPTRRYLHVAVNGRVVDTDSFAPAVARAYADLLPKGRHPAAFLRLDLGPGEVDVNVHPAKSAVRLRGGRSAYPLVVGAIRAAVSPGREAGGAAPPEEKDGGLVPIGQFAGRCIIAGEGDELVILDQHGAHERILYEKLQKNLRGTPEELPAPVVVRLPPELAPEVWNFEAELGALGFVVEPFGAGAVRVLAVPAGMGDAEGALLGAVEALAGGEDLAKALACRGSTKFGEGLSKGEMEVLLEAWAACEFREICPHGRPIIKRISLAELLREFGRV